MAFQALNICILGKMQISSHRILLVLTANTQQHVASQFGPAFGFVCREDSQLFQGGVCFVPLRINPPREMHVGFVCLLISFRPLKKVIFFRMFCFI